MPTTTINPGDSIQTDGHDVASAGDIVSMTPGEYFSQSVNVTKNNMTFQSSTGTASDVVIYGGPEITGFIVAGSYWKAASGLTLSQELDPQYPTQFETEYGAVAGEQLMCVVNTDYYHHVNSSGDLGDAVPTGAAGNFWYDYGTDELWVSLNPSGKTVVLSTQDDAFSGAATGITVQDVTIGGYKIQTQRGAVGGGTSDSHGTGWTLDNLDVFGVFGVGVKFVNDTCVLQNSTVRSCGQMLVGASGSGEWPPNEASRKGENNISGVTIHNNYLYYGNMKGVKPGWEAGATKFAWIDKLTVTHNEVYNNYGFALWTDINCYDILYKWNYVHDNWGDGIKHEISYSAEVAENWLLRNGAWPNRTIGGAWPDQPAGGSGWSSFPGVAIQESNGLWAFPQAGNEAPYGILVHDNLIDDNRGGVFIRGNNRDNDCSNPGNSTSCGGSPIGGYPSDGYWNKAVRVYDNDINWDPSQWTTDPKHGLGDGHPTHDPCAETGSAQNYFLTNDYTINGTRTLPSSGWEYCGGTSFANWQSVLGFDATPSGAAPPTEPYGVEDATDIQLGLLDAASAVTAIDVVEGSGNIVLNLLDSGAALIAIQVSALSIETERINAGGPLVAGSPDWEVDDPAHEKNDDAVGTAVISNWSGAIDVASVAEIAVLNPPQELFHTERYDPSPDSMSYTFPGLDPAQRYKVRIFASENFSGITGVGQRVFSVLANGVVFKTDWDLYAESLAATAGASQEFSSGFSPGFGGGGVGGTGLHVALLAEELVFPTGGGDITITTSASIQSALLNALELSVYDQSVTLDLLDAASSIPSVTVQGPGVQNVTLDFLDAGAQVFALAIAPSNLVVTLDVLVAGASLYAITVEDEGALAVSTDLTGPFWFDVIDVGDTTGTTPSSASVSRTSSFLIGENDTLPSLKGYVRNGYNAILDLSATGINPASIVFSMKNTADATIKVDEQACTWDTATHVVTYAWAVGDTDTAGDYDGEVEVTTQSPADVGTFTAPGNQPKIRITIGGEIS